MYVLYHLAQAAAATASFAAAVLQATRSIPVTPRRVSMPSCRSNSSITAGQAHSHTQAQGQGQGVVPAAQLQRQQEAALQRILEEEVRAGLSLMLGAGTP